jgi:hypothetical protein
MIFNVRNPQWLDAGESVLWLEVQNENGEWFGLVTAGNNSVPEEKMLFNFAKNGLLGEIAAYVVPEDNTEMAGGMD